MNICYLAPQLTALESTFVYEELLALERRGLTIVPVSVSRAEYNLIGHDDLLLRTQYLYEDSLVKTLLNSTAVFLKLGRRHLNGMRLLFSDVWLLGLFNTQSWKLLYQYIVAARLAQTLISQKCCHLHVHFAHVPAQIAMYASAISSIPFTIMAHANDIFERGLLLDRKAQRAAKILTISYFNRDYLESLGVPGNKLAVVRCGVSFPFSQDAQPSKKKDCYRIGTLARLVEKKGVDDLIRAIAVLRDQTYRIELSIAGDGPLLNNLEVLVEQLGLVGLVYFEGSIGHAEVSAWMQDLDIFILACKQDSNGDMDGIPVVLMEAMSQSIPVISTRLSGIPELVIHGKTGLTSEPANPGDLANNIDYLLNSPKLCSDLANNARDHVVQEFSQKVNIDRLLKYFDLDFSVSSEK